jgi:hypothetical protein
MRTPAIPASIADVGRRATPSSAPRGSPAGTRPAARCSSSPASGTPTQVHEVRMPGGARRQLTFFPERSPARAGPTGGRLLRVHARTRRRRVSRSTATTSPTGRPSRCSPTAAARRTARALVARGRPHRLLLHAPQRRRPRHLRHGPARPGLHRPPGLEVKGGGWFPLDWSPDDTQLAGDRVRLDQREPPLARGRRRRGEKTLLTPDGGEARGLRRRPVQPRRQGASTSPPTATPSSSAWPARPRDRRAHVT